MIRAVCLRYFYVLICILAICIVAVLLLDYLYDYKLPAGAGLGLVIWTSMSTGAYWYTQHNGYPTSKVLWQLALYFSIIVYALLAILGWFFYQIDPVFSTEMHSLTLSKKMKIIGVFAVMILFVNRYGFSLGIFEERRQAKRRLAKKKLADKELADKELADKELAEKSGN